MNAGGQTGPSAPPGAAPHAEFAARYRAPGVDSAYRTFERHMQRGQGTGAGSNRGSAYRPGMVDGLQGLLDNYGEMASLLIEILNRVARGYRNGGDEWGAHKEARPSPARPPTTYVCTSIPTVFSTTRQCDVVVELYPYTDLARLKTDDLVLIPENPNYPTLSGVARFLRPSPPTATAGAGANEGGMTQPSPDNRPVLRIEVPATAAAAVYRAQIFDDSNQERGTLFLYLG